MKYFRRLIFNKNFANSQRFCSTIKEKSIVIDNKEYRRDEMTNVTPKILSHLNCKLHLQPYHPLSLIREKIVQFFYNKFKSRSGNSTFSVYDNLETVVSVQANFDSLLVPDNHVSRSKNDCYYVNSFNLLRAHMTAHQNELIRMGLNDFLMIGDVYRRDEIDSSHYPVFHQLDGVKLFAPHQLFVDEDDGQQKLQITEEKGLKSKEKQEQYTLKASRKTEIHLKQTLEELCRHLFGSAIETQWVDAYFPFTHPSWELEIKLRDKWVEVLGCGIMQYPILEKAGLQDRIGWAFGLGLERLAMILYQIPDIRLFWSRDSGFLRQFDGKSPSDKVIYQPVSQFPQCRNDISFWLPGNAEGFSPNDFYEIARDIAGDLLEQVQLIDIFTNPKTGLTSHCYRLIYRHMERSLTKEEVNQVHGNIEKSVSNILKVKIR